MTRLFLFVLMLVTTPLAARAFELALPLDCEIGKTCWLQQYADHDAGPGAADFRCGSAVYDGHDGTDIRARDLAAAITVRAAADGVVKALRDGVDDRLVKSQADVAAVEKIECGNGVVVDHADGYQTQYCHMRKGSIAVAVGEHVSEGQMLGLVGASGNAAFPHLHLTLRLNGKVIDPFSGPLANACGDADVSLWNADSQAAFSPEATSLIRFGWHDGKVDMGALETGTLPEHQPQADWRAMVTHAWVINAMKDDVLTLELSGPGNLNARSVETLDRNKAQYMLFVGKPLKAARWPAGEYQARFTLTRKGVDVIAETRKIALE